MSRKPKFKPEITRVRLDPEQAVLLCGCYIGEVMAGTGSKANFCSVPGTKAIVYGKHQPGAQASS